VKGEKLLSHLRKLRRFRSAVLEMDSKTISELRSYLKPPLPVHGVMMATYVLLGVDQKEIKVSFIKKKVQFYKPTDQCVHVKTTR
jgi:hypothetical protein